MDPSHSLTPTAFLLFVHLPPQLGQLVNLPPNPLLRRLGHLGLGLVRGSVRGSVSVRVRLGLALGLGLGLGSGLRLALGHLVLVVDLLRLDHKVGERQVGGAADGVARKLAHRVGAQRELVSG